MNFGSYNMDRNFIRRGILVWDILNKKDENGESKNLFNQKILDSILDDDDSKFTELVSQIVDEDPKSSHRFSMTNYKFPKILSSNPTYASLCAFFNSEKCFSALTLLCPEGITSEKFQQLDDENRSIIHFACSGGSLNIIRELYEAGFDLNAVDCDGLYPSHYSAMAGTTDVMKYCLIKLNNFEKFTRF